MVYYTVQSMVAISRHRDFKNSSLRVVGSSDSRVCCTKIPGLVLGILRINLMILPCKAYSHRAN
jgi:hypothetical protein